MMTIRLSLHGREDNYVWIAPAHITHVITFGKMTQIELSTGSILCVTESPDTVTGMMHMATKGPQQ